MKRWHWTLLTLLLVATILMEFIYLADYDSHWWNAIPVFYGFWGFVMATLLTFAGKFVSTHIVKRDPDYYDR